jgi:hypothetical protein
MNKKIIHLAIAGKLKELVIAYRDRLTKYSQEKITVLSENDKLELE